MPANVLYLHSHETGRYIQPYGELIGEQHISADPHTLGHDLVHDIPNTRVDAVAPAAIETLRSFFAPSSVRDRVYSLPPRFMSDTPDP